MSFVSDETYLQKGVPLPASPRDKIRVYTNVAGLFCGRFRSTIDYIIIPNCVINSVLYSRTFESCVENTSDHLPVLAKISLDGLSLFKNSVAEITRRHKIRWSDFDK